jgi:succinate-acetate transporter protein
VLPVALFYGGLVQLLAGMWEFRKANVFGAVAFSSYGAFWLSFVGYIKFITPGLSTADTGAATGFFLLAWTIFTAYMTVASIRVSGTMAAVFVTLLTTFILLTTGAYTGAPGISQLGGYLGLLTAVLAWYASFAGITLRPGGATRSPSRREGQRDGAVTAHSVSSEQRSAPVPLAGGTRRNVDPVVGRDPTLGQVIV